MARFFNEEQFAKAEAPIVALEVFKVMEVRDGQFMKAESPMILRNVWSREISEIFVEKKAKFAIDCKEEERVNLPEMEVPAKE
jgi:hypothetical protein